MSDPAAGAGLILRSILRQTGVAGGWRRGNHRAGGESRSACWRKVDGLLLQEQVGRMMRWSNNYIADVLTMGMALAQQRQRACFAGGCLAWAHRTGACTPMAPASAASNRR